MNTTIRVGVLLTCISPLLVALVCCHKDQPITPWKLSDGVWETNLQACPNGNSDCYPVPCAASTCETSNTVCQYMLKNNSTCFPHDVEFCDPTPNQTRGYCNTTKASLSQIDASGCGTKQCGVSGNWDGNPGTAKCDWSGCQAM